MKKILALLLFACFLTPAVAASPRDIVETYPEVSRGIPSDWRLHFAQTDIPTQAPSTQITTTAPVTSDTTISIGTVAGQVVLWIVAAFSAPIGLAVLALLMKVFKFFGVQVTDQQRAQLQAVIVNGINVAASRSAAGLRGQMTLEIRNAIIRDAVQYTQEHAGQTIKALGLDPQSGAAVEAIRARIETALTDPSQPTPAMLAPNAPQT